MQDSADLGQLQIDLVAESLWQNVCSSIGMDTWFFLGVQLHKKRQRQNENKINNVVALFPNAHMIKI